MDMMALIASARQAREAAYAPYSGFLVGAALLTKSGKVYTGCNIENAAMGPGNCAERTAIFKAVSEGEKDFKAIAVMGGARGRAEPMGFCCPCGVCLQVMMEFCEGDFQIIVAASENDYRAYTLEQLLPNGFGPKNLHDGA
ncbi:MAG: cytidine deaminase [Clostridiales bacterium]|jgi:cytidine deaminase|nr:cytidine deaminase [Clostridiales bacterium]